jgi:histidinol phosphatase-like enzyme (inositol monophosphatase family)
MNHSRELAEAILVAREAGELQLSYADKLPAIERKPDASPVTLVDRACEQLIRDHLLKSFPADGFLGEESEAVTGSGDRRWIVDPLDGTRPYLRGIPTHSVLIALEEEGVPVVGVIHLPAMNLTCWATHGQGAFLNGKPIRVSAVATLDAATGSALGFRERAASREGQALFSLMQRWDYAYGFMDAYSYLCVASGKLDLAVNILDKPWDCASAACIVTEAGGVFSDIAGEKTVHNGSIVLSNGLLHGQALGYFSRNNPPEA